MDELFGEGEHTARLAWWLPDWPFELEDSELVLGGPPGQIRLRIEPQMAQIGVARAGKWENATEIEADPTRLGWRSPTYGYKEPAITLVATAHGALPLSLSTWWQLGEIDPAAVPFKAKALDSGPLSEFFAE